VDGNKRTGAVAALVFLMMNGVELHAGEEGLEKMVRSVADGKMDKAGVSAFFRKHGRHES
jgi:death-on-curing protein